MVFVKVRETYDLHTTKNKMTVIGIHTPHPDIIKRNYPGLLLQCRAYRPVSASVRIACASVMPLDPQGIGTAPGDVAPEDVFNPILYKAMSNFGMSQLEARINTMSGGSNVDVQGAAAQIDVDTVTNHTNDFNVYYGLLSNTHDWRHAAAQQGLEMNDLRPLVYEMLYNVGDNFSAGEDLVQSSFSGVTQDGKATVSLGSGIKGNAKPMPFINCTAYSYDATSSHPASPTGFGGDFPQNCELTVPYLKCFVGAIIVPPSRLHELFYRMVIEWTIEFSGIRPVSEITDWNGLGGVGAAQHFQNYSYESTKAAVTGSSETMMSSDACMVSSNVDVNKVM